ncbi:2,3-dimethylmalate lyase [Pyrobaculum islandicum DSM 4184]|uniref:2-methylisocitrate lyase n=1 Tax=Pyrobaculum islandicum (strain DSM 4184 / JCM 9189 / GEO3) TaxID=384616 RepID=A1RV71_PYRIL|nr:methylisocitrate lyase [Pyrobaculum islandicum]ABL88853.1 2,3-dimethylmalate lyase [Pyrobaculum islandicum DSM 4184]
MLFRKRVFEGAKILREEIKKPGIVLVPGVFNALTALMAQSLGFKAVYVSGAAVTASMALPDLGLITMDEMVRIVKYIVDAVDIPVIVDIDTGYGEALNVMRAVREFEAIGAAGVQLEDQVLPKKCGHLSGKALIPPDEMAKKIRAAVEARRSPDFVIIARTDAVGVTGFDDAVERALLYLEAGADVIFPEALRTEEEFREFAQRVRAPLLANMTEFGVSPLIPAKKLEEFGYKFVIFPVTALRVAMYAIREVFKTILEEGTQASWINKMLTRKELYDLIKYYDYEKLDTDIARYIDNIYKKIKK